MPYVDGFVMAVPAANRQAFLDHATRADQAFLEMGALRVTECWQDDVPDGSVTDFRRAVQAEEGESIVFSWIEWPDKATRDAAYARMMDPGFDDERLSKEANPMPFDGKRLIYGGFTPLLDIKGDGQ